MGAFDYTTLAGAFGTIGDTGKNYLGRGGVGARDGLMFAVSFLPNIMLAVGLVKVIEGFRGMECAAALLTPVPALPHGDSRYLRCYTGYFHLRW